MEFHLILYLADIVFGVDWCYVYFSVWTDVMSILADVIAKICEPQKELGLLLLPFIEYGRCYCHVAEGIATRVNYFCFGLADVIAMW